MLEIFRNFVISDTIKQPYGTRNCINLGVIGEDENFCVKITKKVVWKFCEQIFSLVGLGGPRTETKFNKCMGRESKRLRTADLSFAGRSYFTEHGSPKTPTNI